jgi:hypothetical protein
MIRREKGIRRTYTAQYMSEIGKRIVAERDARREALGVPQGFKIPPKPLPSTLEELEAELAEVTAELEKVTAACFRDSSPSQERESLGRHMLSLQYRLWN